MLIISQVVVYIDLSVSLSDTEPHKQVGVGWMMTSGSLGCVMVTVVVCTDPSDKEPHRQVGMGRGITSGI